MARRRSKTALVLTGGGIMGAAYEIGCLTALDRLFAPGFSSRRFDIYIGISAGSVIATLIANRIQPEGLFKTISRNKSTVFNWQRRDIYRPDWMGMTLDFYSHKYPKVDFVILELGPAEALMFLHGPMSIKTRTQVMHHGYHTTRTTLAHDYERFAKIFRRHGIVTREDQLDCEPPGRHPA
jgi:predicted acylesterase/phospholipase RssA